MSASRGNVAADARGARPAKTANAADADKNPRRVVVISWFPEF
jgi:hypothetical protein